MPRIRIYLLALVATMVVAGVTMIGLGLRNDGPAGARQPVAGAFDGSKNPAVLPAGVPPGPDAAEVARQARARKVRALDMALSRYAATVPEFSVAVFDRRSGAFYSYRGKEKYEAASIVKVQVLACTLLRAQDAHRGLGPNELSLAKRMIRLSDNDATTALYDQLGRTTGLTRCNRRLGLQSTVVNSAWGLTRTTVEDQVRIFAELADKNGPLDADSREVAFELMTTVDAAQDWGVGALAKSGETVALKNGWLPRSTEGNRWILNSGGRISGGADAVVVVLSHNHPSLAGGIDVVEQVATLTRRHLRY